MNKNASDHDLILKLHEKVDILLEIVKDHEPRIRKVEQQSNVMRGATLIVVFISGLIEPFLLWHKK